MSSQAVPEIRTRRRFTREAMIGTIIDVARQIMREDGVAGLSLRELARRVGVKAPSLYQYFPNKLAIYEAVQDLAIVRFEALMFRDLATIEGFENRCLHVFDVFTAFGRDHPELFSLLFEHPVPGFVPARKAWAERARGLREGERLLRGALEAEGKQTAISSEQAVAVMEAAIRGMAFRYLTIRPLDPERAAELRELIPVAARVLKGEG